MLKNMLISAKLRLSTLLTVLGLIVLAFVSYTSILDLQSSFERSDRINYQVSTYKSIMIGGLLVNSASVSYAFDPISLKPINSAQNGLDKAVEFSSKIESKNRYIFNSFFKDAQEVLDFAKANQYLAPEHVKKLLKVWKPLKLYMMNHIDKLKKEQKVLSKEFNDMLETLIMKILILIIIVTVIVTILNLLISKGIIGSLSVLENSMMHLAKGDSNDRMILDNKDETSKIAEYFNIYMDKIEEGIKKDQDVISEVKIVIEKINAGIFNTTVKGQANSKGVIELVQELNKMILRSEENLTQMSDLLVEYGNSRFDASLPDIKNITGLMGSIFFGIRATGNIVSELLALIDNSNKKLLYSSNDLTISAQNLSDSSNSQAASLEETAAAIEEVTTTIHKSSENTVKMSNYAKDVISSANEGKELANQTVTSMDEINDEVTQINEALTLIDQIAFQTNILSLNAAVEAATAGEAGKGFAVVAQEVRNLATRSADAANEIKQLVEKARQKAISGKEISTNMIDGYNNLNQNIEDTMTLIDSVARSSKEQQQAMVQINDAIASLDQTTQKNAEEAAKISKMANENEGLAGNLQNAIDRTSFKPECKRRVCDVGLMFDTSKLKLNHITFKNDSFTKAGKGTKFTVKDHHQCALGKWIDEHEDSQLASSNEWKELKEAHEQVHKQMQTTVNINSKEHQNSELFPVTNIIEKNMDIVFQKLNKIREVNCDLEFRKNK
ncbi:MAG: methyl-accepting chemotaxis protein [Campylobacterota bacterium]|nr:methyl-accepting chemotaxis protein [Campylobacterota bacterium]